MATTVLVTGANTGLGKAIVQSLLQSEREYYIFLASRTLFKGEQGLTSLDGYASKSKSKVKVVQLDITDDDSIASCFKAIAAEIVVLDVLVNNAGGGFDRDYLQGTMTRREAMDRTFSLNATSTHLVTEAFMPLIVKSKDAKMIWITSGTSSITEATQGAPHSAIRPAAGWPKVGSLRTCLH